MHALLVAPAPLAARARALGCTWLRSALGQSLARPP